MANTVNSMAIPPESYNPTTPDIMKLAKTENDQSEYSIYKGIAYKFGYIVLGESFKFIGLKNMSLKPFENIGIFLDKYKDGITGGAKSNCVGMYTNLPDGRGFDYIYGVQVRSLDSIPEGLTGIDLFNKRFAVMTVAAESIFKLYGAEEPGDAMKIADEYMKNVWLPEHRDITITNENGECGYIVKDGKYYFTNCFEVYPDDIEGIQMQFYIPLKDNIGLI